MKNVKQMLALIGAVLLIAMYACTLIFAVVGSPETINLLKGSVAATILIPVLLYAYILVARLLKDRSHGHDSDQPSDK